MKKYNTPEIEALALETIDVIAASNGSTDDPALSAAEKMAGYTSTGTDLEFNQGTWSW